MNLHRKTIKRLYLKKYGKAIPDELGQPTQASTIFEFKGSIQPLTSELAYKIYGASIKSMFGCYTKSKIEFKENDEVGLSDSKFEYRIKSARKYNTHTVLEMEVIK